LTSLPLVYQHLIVLPPKRRARRGEPATSAATTAAATTTTTTTTTNTVTAMPDIGSIAAAAAAARAAGGREVLPDPPVPEWILEVFGVGPGAEGGSRGWRRWRETVTALHVSAWRALVAAIPSLPLCGGVAEDPPVGAGLVAKGVGREWRSLEERALREVNLTGLLATALQDARGKGEMTEEAAGRVMQVVQLMAVLAAESAARAAAQRRGAILRMTGLMSEAQLRAAEEALER
jgi:hypothetical protein